MSSALNSFPMSTFDAPVSLRLYRRGSDLESLTVGSSFMRFEPPDTCFVKYVGDLAGEDVNTMNDALERVASEHPTFFLLVDLSRTGAVSESARRYGVKGMRAMNPCGTAVFGADLHRRVVATLITKAASLIDARIKGPVRFFGGEAEARAWLAHLRDTAAPPRSSA